MEGVGLPCVSVGYLNAGAIDSEYVSVSVKVVTVAESYANGFLFSHTFGQSIAHDQEKASHTHTHSLSLSVCRSSSTLHVTLDPAGNCWYSVAQVTRTLSPCFPCQKKIMDSSHGVHDSKPVNCFCLSDDSQLESEYFFDCTELCSVGKQ